MIIEEGDKKSKQMVYFDPNSQSSYQVKVKK